MTIEKFIDDLFHESIYSDYYNHDNVRDMMANIKEHASKLVCKNCAHNGLRICGNTKSQMYAFYTREDFGCTDWEGKDE